MWAGCSGAAAAPQWTSCGRAVSSAMLPNGAFSYTTSPTPAVPALAAALFAAGRLRSEVPRGPAKIRRWHYGIRPAAARRYRTHHPLEIARLPPWGVLARVTWPSLCDTLSPGCHKAPGGSYYSISIASCDPVTCAACMCLHPSGCVPLAPGVVGLTDDMMRRIIDLSLIHI